MGYIKIGDKKLTMPDKVSITPEILLNHKQGTKGVLKLDYNDTFNLITNLKETKLGYINFYLYNNHLVETEKRFLIFNGSIIDLINFDYSSSKKLSNSRIYYVNNGDKAELNGKYIQYQISYLCSDNEYDQNNNMNFNIQPNSGSIDKSTLYIDVVKIF